MAVDEIALRGEYDIVAEILAGKHSPIVIDLGANIGLFSMLVFNLASSATVYSVEPSRVTYQVLEKNRKANPKLNWQTYWSAIWVDDGEIGFIEDTKASTASYVNATGGNTVVPSMSLATLFSKCTKSSIDLLKVDIEGSEEEVLCQNSDLLSRVETIIVEIHPYRCNETRVVRTLQGAFDYLYDLGGSRGSKKPLLLASRTPYDLPEYSGIGR